MLVYCHVLFFLPRPQVSLTQNCQPPRRSGRAAQMQTIFIALLFFPFFVGALSIVAYSSWRYEDVIFDCLKCQLETNYFRKKDDTATQQPQLFTQAESIV